MKQPPEYEDDIRWLREQNAELNPMGIEVVFSGPALAYRRITPQAPKRYIVNGDGRILDLYPERLLDAATDGEGE